MAGVTTEVVVVTVVVTVSARRKGRIFKYFIDFQKTLTVTAAAGTH